MSTTIVTLLLIIVSPTNVSSREQRMTLAECQREMREARSWIRSNERVFGGCILAPSQETMFRNQSR